VHLVLHCASRLMRQHRSAVLRAACAASASGCLRRRSAASPVCSGFFTMPRSASSSMRRRSCGQSARRLWAIVSGAGQRLCRCARGASQCGASVIRMRLRRLPQAGLAGVFVLAGVHKTWIAITVLWEAWAASSRGLARVLLFWRVVSECSGAPRCHDAVRGGRRSGSSTVGDCACG